MTALTTILRTIVHLELTQVWHRLYYILKKRLSPPKGQQLLKKSAPPSLPYTGEFRFLEQPTRFTPPDSFCFLDIKHDFNKRIDWNLSRYGKLWTYNLNYFDYLLQAALPAAEGLRLIHRFLDDLPQVTTGLDPYPVSLRIMNWVKFTLQNDLSDARISEAIAGHTAYLSKNLEHHLLGNHLLENAFALCFGALCTGDQKLLNKGRQLLRRQLTEQVLPDGGHYERSAMYHQLLLSRLLELIHVLDRQSPHETGNDELAWLRHRAALMLGWMQNMYVSSRHMPKFNDAAEGIAPDAQQLVSYAAAQNIAPASTRLKESGFRRLGNTHFEVLADVGNITPSYQPGHAHAGTFSFELFFDGVPTIVNTGTSTYEQGARRQLERSTPAHNTVSVNQADSSEIWAAHRVGRRAPVSLLTDTHKTLEALHNGYKRFQATHLRRFEMLDDALVITDEIRSSHRKNQATAHLHFHPEASVELTDGKLVVNGKLEISFTGADSVSMADYLYAAGFNRLVPARVCRVDFGRLLKTVICSRAS